MPDRLEDIEPPSPEIVQQQWVVHHATVRALLEADGLNLAGLEHARRDLRAGGPWSPRHTPVGFGEQRILLLNDITARLAAHRGDGYGEYYRGTGDLLPESPDFMPDDL